MLDYFPSQRRSHCPPSIPIGVCRGAQVFLNPSDVKRSAGYSREIFVIAERRTNREVSCATRSARYRSIVGLRQLLALANRMATEFMQ